MRTKKVDMRITLVKLFPCQYKADYFRSGKLYCNRLSYFRDLELGKRADPNEGIILLPDTATITITLADRSKRISISREDLVAPAAITPSRLSFLNIFCMYQAHCMELENQVAGDKLACMFEISKKCVMEFGRYAVIITDVQEFLDRVKIMAKAKCRGYGYAQVKYEEAPIDQVNSVMAAFYKSTKFSYQQEYRFAFDIDTKNNKAVGLDIGSIQDISAVMRLPSFE